MSVAIVIVNYNSGLLLERCLQCLSQQTVRADQIVIVDNNSDEPLSHSILKGVTNCVVIHNENNAGYGGAINRAVEELGEYEFICCLNPDAFPKPDWLEKLLAAATDHPEYGSYASLMLRDDDESIVDGAGDVLHISGLPWRRFHNVNLSQVNITSGPVFSACAGAAMYRTDAMLEAGGFDENFFMYVEDVDLGFRLQAMNRPCWFESEAIVSHIGSATTGYKSEFSIYHGHRNVVLCYFKNMPMLLLIICLPFHLLMNLLLICRYSVSGQSRTIIRAKFDAIRQIPATLSQRPGTYQVPVSYIAKILTKSLRYN